MTILAGSLALFVLSNALWVPQLAQSNAIANFFLGGNVRIVFTSILIGLVAPLVIIVPFLLLVAIATCSILKWHKEDKQISFKAAFWHLLTMLLGILHLSVIVDNFEIKGSAKDKERLENYGGPGWIKVYPGQVVVLHHWGKITRAVGMGFTILQHEEQIKAIVPLTSKGGVNTIENVLTRDRVSLDFTIFYAAQMEPAVETQKRLQQAVKDARVQLQKIKAAPNSSQEDIQTIEQGLRDTEQQLKKFETDKIIGDENNQCYEGIAKLVAIKATDVWDALKAPIANNLRDIVMSEYFEKLFGVGEENEDLSVRIDQRKIAAIEKTVLEKAKKQKIGEGIVLRVLDIQQIRFPEKIKEKINEEVKALITAQLKHKRAEFEAKAIVIEAKARAQARVLQGQGEGEAQAALFREILRELKREGTLAQDEIASALLKLISSTVSVKELQSFFKATARPRKGQNGFDTETIETLEES